MATWGAMLDPQSTDPPPPPAVARAIDHPLAVRFAAWMAGSHAAGLAALEAVVAAPDVTAQLAAVVRVFDGRRRKGARSDLDDVLRSDPTAVVDLDHPLIRGDVRRLYVLQHELQRACLTATLLNLPPSPRAAFILCEILGLSFEEAARVMGSDSAVRTAHTRALREIEGYLDPRCEHVNPKNFCHCSTRLGVALERGFVAWPTRDDLPSDGPVGAHRGDARELFAALPPPA